MQVRENIQNHDLPEIMLVAASIRHAIAEAIIGAGNIGGAWTREKRAAINDDARASAIEWINGEGFDGMCHLVGADPAEIRPAVLERIRWNQEHPTRQVDWSTGLPEPVTAPRVFGWEGKHS